MGRESRAVLADEVGNCEQGCQHEAGSAVRLELRSRDDEQPSSVMLDKAVFE